jgi:hypothetical protein
MTRKLDRPWAAGRPKQYRLRSLLIALGIVPPAAAGAWAVVSTPGISRAIVESVLVFGLVGAVFLLLSLAGLVGEESRADFWFVAKMIGILFCFLLLLAAVYLVLGSV